MYILLIITSLLLWMGAFACLFKRQLLAPALSFVALVVISFAKYLGLPVLPINNNILIWWLVMAILVMIISLLQPPQVTSQSRGVGYMTIGAMAGMAVGLLGYSFSSSPAIVYASMIIATIIGEFLGYLLFTNTPRGAELSMRRSQSRFFKYLLAKGFPVAITVMIFGVACVLAIITYISL